MPRGAWPVGKVAGMSMNPPNPSEAPMSTQFEFCEVKATSASVSKLYWPIATPCGSGSDGVHTVGPKALAPPLPVPRRVQTWYEISHTKAMSVRPSALMSPAEIATGLLHGDIVRPLVAVRVPDPLFCSTDIVLVPVT